jgi:hypothetical protein
MAGILMNIFQTIATEETMKQMCITALAIKRYEIQNKRLPENLSQLIPAFLTAIPVDPMDGHPLRYKVINPQQMLLYSTGMDGVDDGGDSTLANPNCASWIQKGKDWIWPKPGGEIINK